MVRPLTAKWHRLSLEGAFEDPDRRGEFREELSALQLVLRTYTKMLADMANVEDPTELEDVVGAISQTANKHLRTKGGRHNGRGTVASHTNRRSPRKTLYGLLSSRFRGELQKPVRRNVGIGANRLRRLELNLDRHIKHLPDEWPFCSCVRGSVVLKLTR